MYAEIILNNNAKALNKIFDYEIPQELEENIHVGSRVFVPFGRSKTLEDGFVLGIKETSEYANKQISSCEGDFMSKERIELAKLMSQKYFCNISECIKLMLPPGTASKELDNRIKEKTGNFVYLAKEQDEMEVLIAEKVIKSEKHIRILRFLYENSGIYITDLITLTDSSHAILKTLEKHGYIEFRQERMARNPFINKNIKRDKAKVLTEEQQICFNGIKYSIEHQEFSNNLIYGITGSGKTEIYLRLIEEVVSKGRTAIVLVPEISLTPQMVDRFLARFGEEKIAVLHSKLSNGERFDEWSKIESRDAKIVIGARSAIFAPVQNLGIIIIDEEHDMSYKSDKTPMYHAKDLAKYLASQNHCPLVLGSATPDVTTFYQIQKEEKENHLYILRNRANKASLPEVEIIDLRQELASRQSINAK
ncbi:MAG: primosomal protein N' [Clostridia bacterium]|nr:primosomal protein N' [Clostridia bacterium]